MYLLGNLVFLSYSSTCCTTVTSEKPAEVELDLKRGMWRFRERHHEFRSDWRNIGTCRYCGNVDSRYGAIGVYDRSSDDHLRTMLRDSHAATRVHTLFMEI